MKRFAKQIKYIIAGILIGGGAILPGVSGGVLAVVFGVYRPLMELIAHPTKAIRRHWRLFVPAGIGFAIGFVLFSLLASAFFENAAAPATCLFIGLIAGTLPELYHRANELPADSLKIEQPESVSRRNAWIAGVSSFVLLMTLLCVLKLLPEASIAPNTGWYLLCGAVWGLSLIVPGLSSSSILIFLGLYQPMTAGVARLDLGVILPVAAGIIITAVALGRLTDSLFRRHYRVCSFAVLGLVVASTLAIVPLQYESALQIGLYLLLAALGFAASMGMDKLSAKLEAHE